MEFERAVPGRAGLGAGAAGRRRHARRGSGCPRSSSCSAAASSSVPRRWAAPRPPTCSLLSDLGMGFLFLLAGYELDPGIARRPAGRLGMRAWVTSLLLGSAAALRGSRCRARACPPPPPSPSRCPRPRSACWSRSSRTRASSTAARPVRRSPAGAIGELGPIVAMAVLLGTRGTADALFSLTIFAAAVVALALDAASVHAGPRAAGWRSTLEQGHQRRAPLRTHARCCSSPCWPTRRSWGSTPCSARSSPAWCCARGRPSRTRSSERKLDAVGWGVFIPIFFVSSAWAWRSTPSPRRPGCRSPFVALILVVRGGPALFWYRTALPHARPGAARACTPRRRCRCWSRSPSSRSTTGRSRRAPPRASSAPAR